MEIDYPATLYPDTRSRALAIFRSLNDDQAAAGVPLCPEWRVVDIAAHVCGIVDDVLSGNVEGLGSDAWTKAQVDKRLTKSLSEICDEWQDYADQIDALVAEDGFFGVRLTGDLILHMHDVQHALGLDIEQGDLATRLAAHRYVPSLQDRAAQQIGVGVALDLTDIGHYPAPTEVDSTIALRCTSYDFLRSVTGRRSRGQVEALAWEGDPTVLLDGAWNTYGPMPTNDVSA